MRTICHSIAHVVPIVGIGLMLAGLFGGPALPAASAADVELFTDQNNWGDQTPYRYQHPWGIARLWGTARPLETAGPLGIQAGSAVPKA